LKFLTDKKWLGINKEKLAFTCFNGEGGLPKDTEAYDYWKALGVNEERIKFLGKEDNWWSAGSTGPCGPDTEIFYWTGKDPAPQRI
jgi:alanyl-tRNA synthetase